MYLLLLSSPSQCLSGTSRHGQIRPTHAMPKASSTSRQTIARVRGHCWQELPSKNCKKLKIHDFVMFTLTSPAESLPKCRGGRARACASRTWFPVHRVRPVAILTTQRMRTDRSFTHAFRSNLDDFLTHQKLQNSIMREQADLMRTPTLSASTRSSRPDSLRAEDGAKPLAHTESIGLVQLFGLKMLGNPCQDHKGHEWQRAAPE